MTMRNFGKFTRGLAVAGALTLSISITACSNSSNNSGTGGTTGVINGMGGATGTGGTTAGTGGVTGTGGTAATDAGTDSGAADPHSVHLNIINAATTGGVPVTRPAPAVSYNDCKI
jgi:hypothetical protein